MREQDQTDHVRRRGPWPRPRRERRSAEVLHDQQAGPPDGHDQQVAQRPVAASPAIVSPDTTPPPAAGRAAASRRSEVKARNRPFSVICADERRSLTVARRRDADGDAEQDRRSGEHADSARLRRRRKISRSSSAGTSNRRKAGPGVGGCPPVPRAASSTPSAGRAARTRCGGSASSLVDIEALPRQRHEQLLEVGPLDDELAYRHAGPTSAAVTRRCRRRRARR